MRSTEHCTGKLLSGLGRSERFTKVSKFQGSSSDCGYGQRGSGHNCTVIKSQQQRSSRQRFNHGDGMSHIC